MSYCRFVEADVYVFLSDRGLECCACSLQEREWIDDLSSPFGGYLVDKGEMVQHTFNGPNASQDMIDHLRKHQEAGHRVPTDVFERLSSPEDVAEVQQFLKEMTR